MYNGLAFRTSMLEINILKNTLKKKKAVNDAIACLLKFEAKKYFNCMHIDRPATYSLQMEIFAHFSHFLADMCLHCGSSLSNFTHVILRQTKE